VSEIGFGAWGIGGSQWIGATESDSLLALHTAVEQGVDFIDTDLVLWRWQQ
jgi:aryl-alcohol dehydrogenase-like predicted oxidoreductase